MSGELNGQRVLVVEDQYLIAQELSRMVRAWGGEVVGPFASRDRALDEAGNSQIDLALLDINLAGEAVYPVAEALEARGIPFMFVTGYARSAVRADFADTPYLDKPFAAERLRPLLRQLVAKGPVNRTRH
jgi:CheY-like chemotaxis protein